MQRNVAVARPHVTTSGRHVRASLSPTLRPHRGSFRLSAFMGVLLCAAPSAEAMGRRSRAPAIVIVPRQYAPNAEAFASLASNKNHGAGCTFFVLISARNRHRVVDIFDIGRRQYEKHEQNSHASSATMFRAR